MVYMLKIKYTQASLTTISGPPLILCVNCEKRAAVRAL